MSYSQQEADLLRENNALKAENERMRSVLRAVDSFISHEYHRNSHRLTDKAWAEEVMRKEAEALERYLRELNRLRLLAGKEQE